MSEHSGTEYWLKGTEMDFELAKRLFKLKYYVYSLYFCHLALEKALKSQVVRVTGKTPPLIHNLLTLASISKIEITKNQENFLKQMNRYQIETRYPDAKYSIYQVATRKLTGEMLKETEVFLKWLMKKMK